MLFHRDLKLWPFDPKIYRIHLCPIVHHWCKFGENLTNTFQDMVLTSPESAVSSILYSTMTLTFDPKSWSFHLCPKMHRSRKFGENVPNTLQDIVLTMFRDAHTDVRMHGRMNMAKTVCHTTLGGGIKSIHSNKSTATAIGSTCIHLQRSGDSVYCSWLCLCHKRSANVMIKTYSVTHRQ